LFKNNKQRFDLEQSTGAVDGKLVIEIVNHYLVAFFDRYLKEQDSSLEKAIHEVVSIKKNDQRSSKD